MNPNDPTTTQAGNRHYWAATDQPQEFAKKTCIHCNAEKPIGQFYANRTMRDGFSSTCKACVSLKGKERHASAPRRYLEYNRARFWMQRYGLTTADYFRLLAAQGGVCAVCKLPPDEFKRLSVDHFHVDGYAEMPPEEKRKHVRGLLHDHCNLFLGVAGENSRCLMGAVAYLDKHADPQFPWEVMC